MRKILLGTTALVAAGVLGAADAQAKFDVTIRGNFTLGYGFVNEDDDLIGFVDSDGDGVADARVGESGYRRQNQALNQDVEMHFRFEQTLDNGMVWGGRVELEGASHQGNPSTASLSQNTDQIDERWMYARGGWGELRVGDEDDARKLKSYAAPEASGIFGVNSPYFSFNNTAAAVTVQTPLMASPITITPQVTGTNSTFPNLENDSAKIIYFTPSFGGFQLAVSYAPDATQDRFQGGTGGTQDTLSNAISVGADYSGEFGGVTLGFGGGYSQAHREVDNDEGRTPSVWAVGANIGFGGFTVGGSVAFFDNDTGQNGDSTVFDVGATYAFDAVTVGVGWSHGEYDNENETDELDHVQLTAGYALGEGVSLGAMVGWFDYEDEGIFDNDNTGWQTGVGINLSI
jgi:hypothetical protein